MFCFKKLSNLIESLSSKFLDELGFELSSILFWLTSESLLPFLRHKLLFELIRSALEIFNLVSLWFPSFFSVSESDVDEDDVIDEADMLSDDKLSITFLFELFVVLFEEYTDFLRLLVRRLVMFLASKGPGYKIF